ncbi:hypothetical protein ACTFIY_009625 [Dictyostelium cf. discoideum]
MKEYKKIKKRKENDVKKSGWDIFRGETFTRVTFIAETPNEVLILGLLGAGILYLVSGTNNEDIMLQNAEALVTAIQQKQEPARVLVNIFSKCFKAVGYGVSGGGNPDIYLTRQIEIILQVVAEKNKLQLLTSENLEKINDIIDIIKNEREHTLQLTGTFRGKLAYEEYSQMI